ncbi:MAG: hypothetical protein Q4B59_00990 [Lachnospiraceae bacterium]|nr:hypothetical protein [Lachnospiraceae bacterium]
MKKCVLAMLAAGVLAAGCAMTAVAEEEVLAIDYSMIDASVYDGEWVTAFGVFDLYLPSDWNILVNLAEDEQPEDNVYFQAANDEETYSVSISAAAGEVEDLETVAANLEENGFEEIEFATINDIPVVSYSVTADGVQTAGIVALGDLGGVYNVTVGGVEGDENFEAIGFNILASFSLPETEEVETE